MNLLLMMMLIAAVAALPLLAAHGYGWKTSANSAGTHAGSVTRSASAALPLAYTVVKAGANPATQVAICGETDEPMGVTDGLSGDNAASGDHVSVGLLGSSPRTLIVIVDETVTAGSRLYTAADGKAQDTAAASAWLIGRALTSGVAGDQVEMDPCFPVQNPA